MEKVEGSTEIQDEKDGNDIILVAGDERWSHNAGEFFSVDHKGDPDDVVEGVNMILDGSGVEIQPVDCGDDQFYFGFRRNPEEFWKKEVDLSKLPEHMLDTLMERAGESPIPGPHGTARDSKEKYIKFKFGALTRLDVLREWLQWEGILGYSDPLARLFNDLGDA